MSVKESEPDFPGLSERRGFWVAAQAAVYCAQIHGMEIPQAAVDNAWRSRYGEKPPLEAFGVESYRPGLVIGITPESVDEWIENFTPRVTRRTVNPPPPRPANHLTVAEVAERAGITRKEAYRLVYVTKEIPSTVFHEVQYSRWKYPFRTVSVDDLEEWIKEKDRAGEC